MEMVLSRTFANKLQSDCSFEVKFDFDKDWNIISNLSCFRNFSFDCPKVEQALNHHSFHYHDNDVQKKYNIMVEITVSQDGTVKWVLVPTNTSGDTTEEAYLIPEKLVSKSPTTCPEHYEYVTKFKACLRFSFDEVNWNEASNNCVAEGGTLVILDTEEKQNAFNSAAGSMWVPKLNFPIDKYGKKLWIGLSDTKNEGKYEWVNGSPITYSRWMSYEPNNRYDLEDCVHIVFYNDNTSLWNDWSCKNTACYACESKPNQTIKIAYPIVQLATTVTPSTTILPFSTSSGTLVVHMCPSGWWESTTSEACYHIGEDGRNFGQSASYCQSVGGTLVSIPNSLEMQYIQGLLERNNISSIWIGLTDRSLEENFEWVDGTVFTFTSWADNQPDDWKANEDCVAIDRTWKYLWIDMSCEIKLKQLCKRGSEKLAIRHCSSGNTMIKKFAKNFILEDLTCPTTMSTPTLVCLQVDERKRTCW